MLPNCTCSNKAGDPCRLHHGLTCGFCGSAYVLRQDSTPCQGKDSCAARLCENCAELGWCKCSACGLNACAEHLMDFSGRKVCAICLDDMADPNPEPDGLDDNRPMEEMV